MTLDAQTLIVVMLMNMAALALAIPAIMGRQLSTAARRAQAALVVQTIGWACLVVSREAGWLEPAVSVLAMAGLSCGLALTWESVRGWLGPRRGRGTMWALAVLMPAGYAMGWGHYPFRVGWANAGLALQMLVVCAVLLQPTADNGRGWRWVMAASLAALAAVTAWRGVLGAFYTDAYPSFRTPHPAMLAAGLIGNLAVALNAVGLLVAWREEAERALQALARTDSLTGLLNRRALHDEAGALIAQARRHGDPLSLLLIDADHFKAINDTRGHATGDRALCLMAAALQAALRRGDLAGRWGGEEFCVVLARTGPADAAAFDARLRAALSSRAQAELGFDLGFSTGLAHLLPSDATLQPLVQRADAALYAAKAAGRGQLAVA